MKKTRLQKEIVQAGNEMRQIDEGKLEPKSLDVFLEEMKLKHGGKRAGTGKKSPMQSVYPNEVKKQVTLRLYPTQLAKIVGK
jgi:hypothetical protein